MKKVTLFSNPISYLYVTCFFVCVTGAVLVSMVYFSHLNEGRSNLRVEANVIENTLSEVFEQTSQLLFHIGKQISSYEKKDLEEISKIIGRDHDESFQASNSLSWMTLGWVGLNNQLLYDWRYGFCNPPISLPARSFITKCTKDPWKLNLSKSAVSLMSGLREIPGGMGITNDKGQYLGTLSVGFGVAELNNKLQTGPHNSRVSYIILDENLRIILQSSDNAIDPDSSYYKDLLDSASVFSGVEGILHTPVTYKNIKYIYYKKIRNSPYYILTGFDKGVFNREFRLHVVPRLVELAVVAILCLLVISWFRRSMFSIAKISEASRLTFYKQVKGEMREHLDQIIVYSDLLRKALRKDIDFALPQNKQLELLENIYSAAINLDASKASVTKPSYIHVNEVIHEGVRIQLYSAFIKGVTIKVDLSPNLPIFEGREIAFKQFIVGLISLGLEYNSKGGILRVSTSLELEDNQAFLVITLQDNGFVLDEKDIKRISEKFNNEGLKALSSDVSLDFAEIENFIKSHGGKLELEPKKNAGKKIIISLPYQNKREERAAFEFNRESVNKICKFTKIKKDISKNA